VRALTEGIAIEKAERAAKKIVEKEGFRRNSPHRPDRQKSYLNLHKQR
jgi:hypothetical protein